MAKNQFINSPPFKLKDKPTRYFQVINFKSLYGFVPNIIVIEKVRGVNNLLIVRAVKEGGKDAKPKTKDKKGTTNDVPKRSKSTDGRSQDNKS